jgi:hypothetical protein
MKSITDQAQLDFLAYLRSERGVEPFEAAVADYPNTPVRVCMRRSWFTSRVVDAYIDLEHRECTSDQHYQYTIETRLAAVMDGVYDHRQGGALSDSQVDDIVRHLKQQLYGLC